MVAATLCTQSQLGDGMRHLSDFVDEFYEKEERNDGDLNPGGRGGGRGVKLISMIYL